MLITINKNQILDWILDIYIRHRCSWELILDILRLVNKVLQKKLLPETKYMFFKFLHANVTPTFFLECLKCKTLSYELEVGNDSHRPEIFLCKNNNCKEINKMSSANVAFVTFPVDQMLKDLLEKNSDTLIFPAFTSATFPINDTWDAEIHKNVTKKEGKFISIFLNTDGVQVFNAAKSSLWPLLLTVNNLPTNNRFKVKNVVCVGFFYGRHIRMDLFLEKFIVNIRDLNLAGGLQLSTGKYKVFCLGTSLDSAAKPKVLQIKQYNGFYSCPYCLIRGVRIGHSTKFPYRLLSPYFMF